MDVYLGDAKDLLSQLFPDSVDLYYLDPPYKTDKVRKTHTQSYDDRWESLNDFLREIESILKLCHQTMAPTASIYVQCDYHASHRIRLLMDKIFGEANFRNHICWKRGWYKSNASKKFGVILDDIFFYTKSDTYTFNPQLSLLSDKNILKNYSMIEPKTLRRFATSPLIKEGKSPKSLVFANKGEITAPEGMRFIWSQSTYEEKIAKNPNCIYWTKNHIPRAKIYLDEVAGELIGNLWDDIPPIMQNSEEWSGYPTEKPRQLLQRMISTSSVKGDLVADFLCGSGTALVEAKRMGRRYVGGDKNPEAIKITKNRLENQRVESTSNLLDQYFL